MDFRTKDCYKFLNLFASKCGGIATCLYSSLFLLTAKSSFFLRWFLQIYLIICDQFCYTNLALYVTFVITNLFGPMCYAGMETPTIFLTRMFIGNKHFFIIIVIF